MALLSRLLFLVCVASTVLASWGDFSQEFRDCLAHCTVQSCRINNLPVSLRLTRWTCTDNCRYACMHAVTDKTERQGGHVVQFYGKWPFWRFGGMQEPASVAFSLLNMWAHVRGLGRMRRRMPKDHPMKPFYLVWGYISMNSWLWSAVFHTRDVSRTERLDYFSAAATILYGLYLAVVRLFHLYPTPSTARLTLPSTPAPSRSGLYKLWTAICVLVYVGHVAYLSLLPRFDYSYNIIFNVVLGLSHNLLWLFYSLPAAMVILRRFPFRPKSYRPAFATKAGVFVALTTAATALEVFDFPAWGRIIDAHSLWHLATAPIAMFWYEFLIQDSLDSGWSGHRA